MPYTTKYTVVQHSGMGYGYDTTFAHGLESRAVNSKADERKVIRAGGALFDSYSEAEDFADQAMYPPGPFTMIPEALGSFSAEKIDGLRIYLPIREVVG